MNELDPLVASELRPPGREEVAVYAEALQIPVGGEELDNYLSQAALVVDDLSHLADVDEPGVSLGYPKRSAGRQPTKSEDPCNAIIRFCEVKGAGGGPLAGMRAGIKDTIPVAGVPMTDGQIRDREPIPAEDAVVVERLLHAGAVITAKTNTGSVFGETRNPRDPRFSPGFSSSGSAAAVANGLVDIALGTDLAGSVRIPAAWCGTIGMKPTHGLIESSYGIGAHRINEVGPITATVADNVAMLEVMATDTSVEAHREASRPFNTGHAAGVEGLRIGVVAESMEPSVCTAGTLRAFERAQARLTSLGGELVPVSVPLWGAAATILLATTHLSEIASAAHWLGKDYDYEGRIDESLFSALTTHRQSSSERAPFLLVGEHLRRRGEGATQFIRAHNLRHALRRQVAGALANLDLLVTPTTVTGPFELDDERLSDPAEFWRLLRLTIRNTSPLNLSGHPALSVPSGPGDNDLPTGLQIVGRPFEERSVYRVGLSFAAGPSQSPVR